jgi:hypothetical protein
MRANATACLAHCWRPSTLAPDTQRTHCTFLAQSILVVGTRPLRGAYRLDCGMLDENFCGLQWLDGERMRDRKELTHLRFVSNSGKQRERARLTLNVLRR